MQLIEVNDGLGFFIKTGLVLADFEFSFKIWHLNFSISINIDALRYCFFEFKWLFVKKDGTNPWFFLDFEVIILKANIIYYKPKKYIIL